MNLYFFWRHLWLPLLFSVCIMYKFPVKHTFYVHMMVEYHPVLLLTLNNGSPFLLNTYSHILYLNFFQNSQPQSVLKLFLISTQRWGSCSYKKKNKCTSRIGSFRASGKMLAFLTRETLWKKCQFLFLFCFWSCFDDFFMLYRKKISKINIIGDG